MIQKDLLTGNLHSPNTIHYSIYSQQPEPIQRVQTAEAITKTG